VVEQRVDQVIADLAKAAPNVADLRDRYGSPVAKHIADTKAGVLLAAMMPETMKIWMMTEIDAAAEREGGWPQDDAAERRTRIENLELEVAEAEMALRATRLDAKKAGIRLDDDDDDDGGNFTELTYRPPPAPPRAPRPEEEAGTFDAPPQFGGQPLGAKASKLPAWAVPPGRAA
jgi:hypothetical protein